ncbi:MAG: LysM peptidoglycan-binding domain-containing protein [bacterium]
MGTIKRHINTIFQCLEADIKHCNKRLLLAAVFLFCLSLSLVNPVKGMQGILFSYFDNKEISLTDAEKNNEKGFSSDNFSISKTFLTANTLASLNDQTNSIDNINQNTDTDEFFLATLQNNALLTKASPITLISQKPRDETITYTVQQGDTSSSIAVSFGISIDTLLWANSLNSNSIIRPGDELIILPTSGVVHRVKSNETIGWIANYYKVDSQEIIAFNNLPADGNIQINQKLIIPGGRIPTIVATTPTYTSSNTYSGTGTGKNRSFPYGQCTWYIAQKRIVEWSGHAKSWLTNAVAYGYKTGTTPQLGAIMVMTEGGWLGRLYGHVAYVESVKDGWVTISEMNYTCLACKSVRTLKATDKRIRGYIY